MARWETSTMRCDGLVISKTAETDWIIRPGHGLPVEVCPCCQRGIRTMENARRLADILFPLPGNDDPEPPQAA